VGGDVEAVVEWVEDEFMQRSSHALADEGRTWLVDPVDNPHVGEFAEVAGVIQLLDRHKRDCARLASRFGVPHHVVPQERIGPFEFLPVKMSRRWREVALWWPERATLVCADVLGTAEYYCAGNERLAVHPLLRLRPPRFGVRPQAILCGHGPGLQADADAALREALRTSRRRAPKQLVSAVRAWRRRR
jgi:hypothetical protein